MLGPFSDQELESLDAIEGQLILARVPGSRMIGMCANFLLSTVPRAHGKQFLVIEEEILLNMSLGLAVFDTGASNRSETIKASRMQLWRIHDHLQREQPSLAALARCAIFCLCDEEWDPDSSEDPTPIPFFLFLLKRFDRAIGMDFLDYARAHLLSGC
ncbi:hypothetical protein [Variovorax atrisoli]|uniref:hypothetical protein n=1 Tax=Variovorax atrisoli TaxID=3394203 RepID=UPI0033991325